MTAAKNADSTKDRRIDVVPWPNYHEHTGEPWWTVRLRTGGRSYWLAWGGRQKRLARSSDHARARRDGHGALLDGVITDELLGRGV